MPQLKVIVILPLQVLQTLHSAFLSTSQPVRGNLLAVIATTTEKMNAGHGIPALQVVQLDVSHKKLPDVSSEVSLNGGVKGFRRADKNGPAVGILEGPTDSISHAEVRVHSGRLNKNTPQVLKIALVSPIR